jgi:Rrf2 family protein
MQITRQADYALRAVIFLARMEGDEKASTSAIAEKQKIPPSFLAKIVSQLSLAGLIQTSRGARGGVSLAKRPEEISVLDVIEAIDGPVMLNDCAGSPDNCPFGQNCPLQHIWCDTRRELVDRLSSATFARDNIH